METLRLHAGGLSQEPEAVLRPSRRQRRIHQELASRALLCLLILAFHEFLGSGAQNPVIRYIAMLGIVLNGPYYLAARTRLRLYLQAYVRMLVDIALTTVGLYSAGGLAAAPYVSVYVLIAIFAGIALSAVACLVAAGVTTASYLALALLQQAGWFPALPASTTNQWPIAIFNLLVVNAAAGLTAILSEAYRRSRHRLAALYAELERNALTVALSHIDMLGGRTSATLPAEVSRHLESVKRSCDAALRIVRNVLDTARQPAAQKVPVRMVEIVDRVIELKSSDLRRDGISIRLDLPSTLPLVLGVPSQLEQVILNLVTNAQEALRGAPHPRAIDIVGVPDPQRAVIEVRDTGPGIPSEALASIFEPFYTAKPNGTGLALAISAGIARELGGELTAANRPEGGAVVRLSLPAIGSDRAMAG